MRFLFISLLSLIFLFVSPFISSLSIKPFYFEGIDIESNARLRYAYRGEGVTPQWQIYWEQEGGKLWRVWMAAEGPSGSCPSLLSLSSSSPLDYLSSPLPLSFHDISPSSSFQASKFNKNNTQIIALPFFPSSALPPAFATHNEKDVSAINWIGGYWKTNFSNDPDDFHPFVLTPPQPSTCLEINEKNEKKSPIVAIKKHRKINKNNKNANKQKKYQGVTGFSRVGGNDNVPNCADIKSLYWYFAYNVYPTHSNPTASACDYSCSDYTTVQDSDLGMTGTDAAYICTPSQTALTADPSLPTLVAFSGSANTVDWLEDFNIIGVRQFDMTTHAGFYHKFSLWQSWLDSFASTLLTTSTPIIFTGHSMGGAIANVAAVYWKNKYPSSSVSLQTFGAPSSFQKPFSSIYQSIPNTRYVNYKQGCGGLTPNEQDPVPVVAEIASYFHPVPPSALTETCNGWSSDAISIIPVIGDLDFSLHTQYGEFTDDVNP